jgi:hypothetical protein
MNYDQFLLIFLGVLILVTILAQFVLDRLNSWKNFINDLEEYYGLITVSGRLFDQLTVIGNYSGHPVKFELISIGSYYGVGFPRIYSRFKLNLKNKSNRYLFLSERKPFQKTHSYFHDPDFDKGFSVESRPEDLLRNVLVSENLRKRIKESHIKELILNGDELSLCIQGVVDDVDHLFSSFQLLRDIANRIEEDMI